MRFAACLIALVTGAAELYGQRATLPAYRARVLGVFDDATGGPIDSVRVTDVLNGNWSMTTETGTVGLYFLPDGGALVRVQKIGYEPRTLTIAISPADTAPITMTLRRVTELAPVVSKAHQTPYISPSLRGFEERRLSPVATGYFVSDSVLRANEGHLLADVLRSRMPNLKIAEGVASAMFVLKSARCVGGGPPDVYLDGVPQSPELRPDAPGFASFRGPERTTFGQAIPGTQDAVHPEAVAINISNFDVSDLAGVEWYPDSDMLPVEFNHSSKRCGALLLWTREK